MHRREPRMTSQNKESLSSNLIVLILFSGAENIVFVVIIMLNAKKRLATD